MKKLGNQTIRGKPSFLVHHLQEMCLPRAMVVVPACLLTDVDARQGKHLECMCRCVTRWFFCAWFVCLFNYFFLMAWLSMSPQMPTTNMYHSLKFFFGFFLYTFICFICLYVLYMFTCTSMCASADVYGGQVWCGVASLIALHLGAFKKNWNHILLGCVCNLATEPRDTPIRTSPVPQLLTHFVVPTSYPFHPRRRLPSPLYFASHLKKKLSESRRNGSD